MSARAGLLKAFAVMTMSVVVTAMLGQTSDGNPKPPHNPDVSANQLSQTIDIARSEVRDSRTPSPARGYEESTSPSRTSSSETRAAPPPLQTMPCGLAAPNAQKLCATGPQLKEPQDPQDPAAPPQPVVTVASVVATAFQSVPVPKPVLGVQPPGGETLVNIETVFAADATPFTSTVTLLGQAVTLAITPLSFAWTHGDGTSRTTATGGRPLSPAEADRGVVPDTAITHTYRTPSTVTVSVAVTWTATWRVGNGPAQPVPGSVTTQSAPQALAVLEAAPQLTRH